MALSHTIFISFVYRPNRGEGNQHQHLKWQLDGTQPHGVVLVLVLRHSVACWAARCQESLTSPIMWTHRALNRLLGNVQPLLQRPGLPSNSKVPVFNRRIVSVTTSRNMNVINLDIFINLSVGISLTVFLCIYLKVFVCYYFESNHLHFVVCICSLLHCRYSLALFLKYSFAITLKAIACIFWKVFVLSANRWTLRTLNYEPL